MSSTKVRQASRIHLKRPHPRVIVIGAGHDLTRPERVWADREAARTGADIVVVPGRVAGAVEGAPPEDTIVVGTGEGGVLRHLLRDDAPHPVLSVAQAVVVVVPGSWSVPPSTKPARISIGYGADPASRAALDWAVRRARLAGARLDVIRAIVPLPGEHPAADSDPGIVHARDVLGADSVDVRHIDATLEGAARAVRATAADADLLVVGNSHASLLATISGWSVAERIAIDPPCPVALVPAREAER